MGKSLFVLHIPRPTTRKAQPAPTRPHRNKTRYTRKQKHCSQPETGA